VLEAGGESPDRRFALAWTVSPIKPGTPDYDWSKWSAENQFAPLDDPNVVDQVDAASSGKYVAKNVILDLERKKAYPLLLDLCRISKRMETSSSSSWQISWIFNEGEQRVAAITTSGRRGVSSVEIVAVSETEVKEIPVLDRLWEFAKADLKQRKVKNASALEYMHVEMKGTATRDVFPIEYSVFPLSGEPSYEKTVNLVLTAGGITIKAASGKAAAASQAAGGATSLADADVRLNGVYKALQGALSPEKMAALRTEQRQWIKDRDTAVKSALSKAGVSSASKEGKNLTDQVMLKWTLQRCEVLEAMAR
jgi:uncharacterized protein YecT (DUF1311 family)